MSAAQRSTACTCAVVSCFRVPAELTLRWACPADLTFGPQQTPVGPLVLNPQLGLGVFTFTVRKVRRCATPSCPPWALVPSSP